MLHTLDISVQAYVYKSETMITSTRIFPVSKTASPYKVVRES